MVVPLIRWFVALATLLGSAHAAHAQDAAKGWKTGHLIDINGQAIGCKTEKYLPDSRLLLRFGAGQESQGGWVFSLRSPAFDGATDISVLINDIPFTILNPQRERELLVFGASLPMVDAMASGSVIDVVVGGVSVRSRLLGSSNALEAAAICANELLKVERKDYTFRVMHSVPKGALNVSLYPGRNQAAVGTLVAGTSGVTVKECIEAEGRRWCWVRSRDISGWATSGFLFPEIKNVSQAPLSPTAPESQPGQTPAQPPAAAPQPPLVDPQSPPAQQEPSGDSSGTSSGTAFFVSDRGHLLTNAHVVRACKRIQILHQAGSEDVSVIAADPTSDLALLGFASRPPAVPAFRGNVRLGEDIAVFGFPLFPVLSSGGTFTQGSISALTGMRDDSGIFQISAQIQPGNSGGPVLDEYGNIVGVVVSKLDAMSWITNGILPEGVNFAIKSRSAMSFLEAQHITIKQTDQIAESRLAQARKRFPDFAHRSDLEIADLLYKNYYSDMPRTDYDAKLRDVAPPLSKPDLAEYARNLSVVVVCLR
jgi:S1-C subfamily serine protease